MNTSNFTSKLSVFSSVDNTKISDSAKFLLIILVALSIRTIMFTGQVRGDGYNYAHAAYELSNGRLHFDVWEAGTIRIGFYSPVALIYKLFGANIITTVAFPLLSSLFTIYFVYLITKSLSSTGPALLAAAIQALNPLDIFLSTTLIPDVSVSAVTTAGIYFFLRGKKARNKHKKYFVTSAILFVWGISIKQTAAIPILFVLLYVAFEFYGSFAKRLIKKVAVGNPISVGFFIVTILTISAFFVNSYIEIQSRPFFLTLSRTAKDVFEFLYSGQTHIDLSAERITQTSALISFGLSSLVAIVYFLREKIEEAKFPIIWFFTMMVIYEYASISTNLVYYNPISNFVEQRSLLFLIPPLSILLGIFLHRGLGEVFSKLIAVFVPIVVVLVAWTHRPVFDVGLTPNWLFPLFLVTFPLGLYSPFVLDNFGKKIRKAFFVCFSAFLMTSFLLPNKPFHYSYWQWAETRELTESFKLVSSLEELRHPDEIFFDSRNQAMLFNIVSDFRYGFDWSGKGNLSTRLVVSNGKVSPQSSQTYWVRANSPNKPGGAWEILETIGENSYYKVYVYQAVNREK